MDKMGYLVRISFLGYNLKSYPDYHKISYNILSYPIISFHILSYPKISSGANSQMEASSAMKVLQHGLTPPLSPHTPSPRVWAGDWALVRKVSDGVEDEGLGPWGIE